MRAKPILQIRPCGGALALPGMAYRARPRQADRRLFARTAAVGADRAHCPSRRRSWTRSPRASPIRRCIARTISRTRACCRARASRSSADPTTRVPAGHDAARRSSSRISILLVEVNWAVRPRRARLHVPARSSGSQAATAVEPVTPMRAGARRRRRRPQRAPRRRDAPPAPPRARPRARGGRRHVQVKRGDTLSKIAKEYKPERDARPDAGRAVQEQPERVRRQQHEPAARRRDHHDPERRARPPRRGAAKRPGSCACRPPIGAPIATASPARRRSPTKPAAAPPAGRIGTAVEETTPAARRDATSSSVSQGRRSRQGRGCCRRQSCRAAKRCAKRKARIAELEKTLQGSAAGGRAAQPDDGAAADAGRRGQGQGRAAAAGDPDHDGARAARPRRPRASRRRSSRRRSSRRRPPNRPRRLEPRPRSPRRRRAAQGGRSPPRRRAAEGRRRRRRRRHPRLTPKAPPKEPPGFFDDLFGSTPGWVDRRRRARDPRRHRGADRRAPAQDDQVRGQHHLAAPTSRPTRCSARPAAASSTPATTRSPATSAARASATSTPTKSIRSPKPRSISPTAATRRPRKS